MKIAFLVGNFPALSETFILNQIVGFLEQGHEVDIYADHNRKEAKVHPDVANFNLLSRCYYLPENKLGRAMKGIALLLRNWKLIKTVNIFKYGKGILSLRTLYTADQFNRRGNYDIVYCHFGNIGNIGAIIKDAGFMPGKLVTTFHGYDISALVKEKGRDVFQLLFEKGDLFLPISNNWKSELVKLGCSEQKISVHRMGIDTDKFALKLRSLSNGETVRLVTIARLVEKKGVEYGIRAVAKVLQKHPNLKLEYLIVGNGPLRSRLEEVISQTGMEQHIKLLGWREQQEVIAILEGAHIFLAPSITASNGDQEGIPVVLMESLSMGIPVISTLHSGIPELIQDTVSGYLVPEKEVESLVEKINLLTNHHQEWSTMGIKGRQYVEENYNIRTLNDNLIGLFQRIVS
ncbi:glycosyltransferase [Paenibacillus beijingensis]|uniref:Glycosyltransferase n=1 Tax=Paenibacillus beijingensis TaxID=1126833 RepID=A0A0D5NGC9_9BACL|nr:glycosyltransferase [Paenibacillus beijingensis]AJY73973.1 glycosyltransferase [Paenibacillus beijingensis]